MGEDIQLEGLMERIQKEFTVAIKAKFDRILAEVRKDHPQLTREEEVTVMYFAAIGHACYFCNTFGLDDRKALVDAAKSIVASIIVR